MAITALPTPPSRSDPTNFATRGDAFLTALPTFATEANALQVDVNVKQAAASSSEIAAAASAALAAGYVSSVSSTNATGTSAQTKTTGTGSFTFTDVPTGKSWVAGQSIRAYADSSNYMIGTVTSYSGSTLVFNSTYNVGTASRSAWSFFPTGIMTMPMFSNTSSLKPLSSNELATVPVPIAGVALATSGLLAKSSSLGILGIPSRNYCVTTADGTTWTMRNLTLNVGWTQIAAYGTFALITDGTDTNKSTDGGVTWTSATAQPLSLTSGNLVAAATNIMALPAYSTSHQYSTTSDGTTYTTRTPQFPGPNTAFGNQVYNVNAWATVMIATFGIRYAMRSTDSGATWAQIDLIANKSWHGSISNVSGNVHIMYGDSTNSASLARSTDNGATWASVAPGGVAGFHAGAWNGTTFVIYNTSYIPYTSTTGSAWTAQANIGFTANSSIWAATAGVFVTVGANGNIVTSPTGVTHTSRTSGVSTALYGVVDTGTKILVSGASGVLLSSNSSDGTTWGSVATATTETLTSMIWTGSLVIGRTLEGSVFTCNASGGSFTLYPQDSYINTTAYQYRSIAWDGTKFILTSSYTVATGTTVANTTALFRPSAFAYGTCNSAGTALAVRGKTVLRTTDGVTWTAAVLSKPVAHGLASFNISADDKWYLPSHDGATLFSSADGSTWAETTLTPMLNSSAVFLPYKTSATGPFLSNLALGSNSQVFMDASSDTVHSTYSPDVTNVGLRDKAITLSNGKVLIKSATNSIATLNTAGTSVFSSV